MKRLNKPFILVFSPFLRLLDDVNHILITDMEDHAKQLEMLSSMKWSSKYSRQKIDKMEARLAQSELRMDYFSELVARVSCHDYLQVKLALDTSIEEARAREGKKNNEFPNKYGFSIQFCGQETDCIIF